MAEQFANFAIIDLTAPCGPTDATISVSSPGLLPSAGTFRLLVENEIMLATARSGATVSVTRGVEGTAAASHALAVNVAVILTAGAIAQLTADILASAAASVASGYTPTYVLQRITHATPGPFTLTGSMRVLGDVSGGALPTLLTPATPTDGMRIGMMNSAGSAATTNMILTANAGQTIEDPNAAAGTFSATATNAITSASYDWIYDLPNTRWKLLGAKSSGATVFVIDLMASVVSAQVGISSAKRAGARSYDPTHFPQLAATSKIILHALLETNDASNAAFLQLFRFTGTGSPLIVATVTTASLTCIEVTSDVSSSFIPGQAAGIFFANLYLASASSTDIATCSGAWLEITP